MNSIAHSLAPRQTAASPLRVLIVNDSSDADDGDLSNGVTTLREAINAANSNAGSDTINFNIPGTGLKTIIVGDPNQLPAFPLITDPVTINGLTQSGASCASWPPTLLIELGGNFSTTGLAFKNGADYSIIKGLSIHGHWEALTAQDATGLTIQCNFVGVTSSGNISSPNATGIRLTDSPNAII